MSELLILDEIMRRIRYNLNLLRCPDPATTSTSLGGRVPEGRCSFLSIINFELSMLYTYRCLNSLVALMLDRLQMTTGEALQTYNSLARAIFSKDNRNWKGRDTLFKATTLKRKVQEEVLKKGRDELMLDPLHQSRKGKTFVCAVPANSIAYPRLFRTYPVRKTLASANCKIWETARATTVAPAIFKRITISEEGQAKEEFIDGGLGCNNPATQVLEEARNIFGNDGLVRCLISVGAGLAKLEALQNVLPTKLIGVLKNIDTDCEHTAHGLNARFNDLEKFYFRFNVAHSAEGISLEEWDKIGKLTEHTKDYLVEFRVSKAIDEVVDILSNPREVRTTLGSVCQSL